ncbi:MAG: sulfotransferase family protein [Caulobacteraceae bacterium]|nr:sulfotransferase family protein [Caulobacteraceae bacterium]
MTSQPPGLSLVMDALRAQDIERAADLAEAALRGGAQHALLFNLRAWRAERSGRYDAALVDLQRARRLAPGDIPTLNALGLCLANLQRPTEALETFDAAIALDPAFAPAHFNRGWVSEEVGELDQARSSFEAAARLNPADPLPHARLAGLAARASDWTAARALAERALAGQPGQPTAALALAAADIAQGALEAARAQLLPLTAMPGVSPIDKAQAHGLLGDIADRQDDPAIAFSQFAAANETLRGFYAPRFAGPGVQTVPEMLSWLIRYFEAAPPVAWRGAGGAKGTDCAGHVFLLGFPRSGTTLLERVLTVSPEVLASEERETLTDATAEFMRGPTSLDRLAAISPADAERHRRIYWDRVRALGDDPAGRVFIDKLPLNSIKLPLIAKLFPQAKILFALRDPRDVVLSCFRQRFRVNPSMFEFLTLEGAARFYAQVMGLADLYRARFPLAVLAHHYEDLVSDFEGRSRTVCEFIGVDWTPDMRRFAESGLRRSIATPSATQVSRGLYDGAGQWRRYADHLAPVIPILQPWIDRFGY